MRVIRSDAAHAEVLGIETAEAAAVPGVQAVLTASGIGPIPRVPMRINTDGLELDPYLQPVLAEDRVRYVGEPVALLVADDPYVAEDAAELVTINMETLPAVLDARAAIGTEAPRLFGASSNEAGTLHLEFGEVEKAFRTAWETVDIEVAVGRHSAVPMETRGLVAEYDSGSDRLTVWGATKVPHFNRDVLAGFLEMDPDQIVMRGMDAGGGFGTRGEFYPEDYLVPFVARLLDKPVKWIEDRAEHLVAANHSREQVRRLSGAFEENGRLLAIKDELFHDNGAYVRTHSLIVPEMSLGMLPGPYRVPAYSGVAHCAVTNKTPCGTYRAPGRYEATFARERLLDVAADQLGINPVDIRRVNLLTSADLPHERPIKVLGHPVRIEVGDFAVMLEDALRDGKYHDWVQEANALRQQGHHVGVGVACFLEKSGGGGYETVRVTLAPDEMPVVAAGSASLGQGVETVLARVVAGKLGIEPHELEVVAGDTDAIPSGRGSWASRSTIYAGGAAELAASAVADRIKQVAGSELGCEPKVVALRGGRAFAPGGTGSLGFSDIARMCQWTAASAREDEPGLSATKTVSDLPMTYPAGVHIALVELDVATGSVGVRRYHVAYDVGRAIDLELVRGQLTGGAAQGISGALLERFAYDQSGQPLATSFMDYLLPTAAEVPPITTTIYEGRVEPGNPLGVRGAGEGGVTAAGAAIAAAVDDALGAPGAVKELPLSPEALGRLSAASRRDPQPS